MKSPKASLWGRAIPVFLAALVLLLSATIVALSARSLLYWNTSHANRVKLLFLDYRWDVEENWTNTIYYSSFVVTVTDTQALMGAGILNAIFATVLLTFSVWPRTLVCEFTISGRRTRRTPYTGPSAALVLDASLAVVNAIVAGFVWHKWRTSDWKLRKFDVNDWPRHSVDYTLDYWDPDRYHTIEAWNCVVARNTAPDARNPSGAQLQTLCESGEASRMLILILLGLVLARVAMFYVRRFLAWRSDNIRARARASGDTGDTSVKMMDWQTQESSTPGGTPKELHARSVAELPAGRTSQAEMDEAAAIRELPGENGSTEVEASVPAAAELDSKDKG